jgi:hypothetical protein
MDFDAGAISGQFAKICASIAVQEKSALYSWESTVLNDRSGSAI